jgi:hypothetical protein
MANGIYEMVRNYIKNSDDGRHPYITPLNDALMFVKGDCGIFWSHFWVLKKGWRTGSLLDCGQDREGPLG